MKITYNKTVNIRLDGSKFDLIVRPDQPEFCCENMQINFACDIYLNARKPVVMLDLHGDCSEIEFCPWCGQLIELTLGESKTLKAREIVETQEVKKTVWEEV